MNNPPSPAFSALPPEAVHTAIVVGAGPAGLFAAEQLSAARHDVLLCDHMAVPARKLLMAGKSGLNITHDEPEGVFLSRYGSSAPFMAAALKSFTPADLRSWAAGLGEESFSGTSGRVLIQSAKATPLLRAWRSRLEGQGVRFEGRRRLVALSPLPPNRPDGARLELLFEGPGGEPHLMLARTAILAMGGGSWARLGSDGRWTGLFKGHANAIAPFQPANCGFVPDWQPEDTARHEGDTLRGVELRSAGEQARGDIIITKAGWEGRPLYALTPQLRAQLSQPGPAPAKAVAHLDLRPNLTDKAVLERLQAQRPRESRSNRLRKALKLTSLERSLLALFAPDARTDTALAHAIKNLPVRFTATEPLDRAISTAGGLKWDQLDRNLMLRATPGLFACGEMLDWEAPTGGYLLQGCFSTAHHCAEGVKHWLQQTPPGETP
ncbi:TIGR03862 family flavoprotein [Formicincola oecophyllae]|uniref:TIGR03862 family flavoprotein n=2 Tax=Formicincola oecophyllae TaxID=2558361 RepID=A0A4Y6UBX0_9PROT|nr:TIGR03862 family flavoprotein [Formicincola oecophyllae]